MNRTQRAQHSIWFYSKYSNNDSYYHTTISITFKSERLDKIMLKFSPKI